jgi:hypothetical protein
MTRTPSSRRVAWLAAALVTTVALAAPALARASGGAWIDDYRVSTAAMEDTSVCGLDAALDDDGTVTYVWCQLIPGGESLLQSRVYRADGTAEEIRNVTEPGDPGSIRDMVIDTDASGTVHVAWISTHQSCNPFCSEAYDVKHVELDPDGLPVGAPVTVRSVPLGDDDLGRLDLSVNAAGEALVAWVVHDGDTGTGAAEGVPISAGGDVGSILDLSEDSPAQWPLSVALADNGDAFAAWAAPGGTAGRIVARAIDAAAGPLPIRSLATPDRNVEHVQALIDAGGNGTAVFDQQDETFSDYDVFVRKIGSNGELAGTGPTEVATETPGSWSAAIADSGAVTVAWAQGLSPYELRSRVIDAAGAAGPSNVLAPPADWDRPVLGLAPDGSGKVLATDTDESGHSVLRSVAIAPDGTAVGAPEPVAPYREGSSFATAASVAVNARGDAAAAWLEEFHIDFFEFEAHGAFFDGSPPEIELWTPPKGTPGEPVVMAAEGSDRAGVSYSWSFGDGGAGAGQVARHAYAQPGTYLVELTAEDGAGNATTVKAPLQVVAPPAPGGGGGADGDGDAPRDVTPPDTKILSGPARRTGSRRPRVRFIASEPGATFQCKLDRGRWTTCKSRARLKKLKYGKHTFQVRARDAAGNVDRFPDSRTFTVVKPKRKR